MHRVVLALLTILLLAAPAQSTTLSRYGLSLELPAGWEGRIDENETGLRVIRAGNFPHALTEKGDVVGEETLQWMGSEGIHVTI